MNVPNKMEYLHKHKEEFINAVNLASEYFHIFQLSWKKITDDMDSAYKLSWNAQKANS